MQLIISRYVMLLFRRLHTCFSRIFQLKDGVFVDVVVHRKQVAISRFVHLADDICRYERTQCIREMFLHDFVCRLFAVTQQHSVRSADRVAGQADATKFLDLDNIYTQFSRSMSFLFVVSHGVL